MYQNRASLIGFLGKDAEVKTTRNKTTFVILSLATKRTWKDRESGEWTSETTWHRCVVWGKLGQYASRLSKGAHVQIEGEIRNREFSQNSGGKDPATVTKSIAEVRVASIKNLSRPNKAEGRETAA